jgi:hypothetical protein
MKNPMSLAAQLSLQNLEFMLARVDRKTQIAHPVKLDDDLIIEVKPDDLPAPKLPQSVLDSQKLAFLHCRNALFSKQSDEQH